ncbi:MAG TPA: SRPBCC family protein [Candidatus Limnocylindrales bacterium]|nr:SRPBCC family protein [Candidatus Limnocylindrales bacterium]
MPAASRTVSINRSPDDVYAFLLDGTTATKWRSGVMDIALKSGLGVGAVYTQGVKGPGGRRINADYQITALEPGKRIAFKAIAGPVRPTGSYQLAREGDGTSLTFSLDAELSGLKKLLMGGAVQSTMNAEMQALDRLKAVLEG